MVLFKCIMFLHMSTLLLPLRTAPACPRPQAGQVSLKCAWWQSDAWTVSPRKESLVSGLKLAVTADWDLRGRGSRSSVLVLCATVAGLRAAQARGGRQQVRVMAALLQGFTRGALRGQERRILLQSGQKQKDESHNRELKKKVTRLHWSQTLLF